MNSLFGLFDSFAAQILLAQSVGASDSDSDSKNANKQEGGNSKNKNKNKNSTVEPQQRLTPDSDGFKCFETLVLY